MFQNAILLQPPAVSEEQEEQKELKERVPEDILIYKPPISKPWVSLGSEKEIEEESVKEPTKQVRGLNIISVHYLPTAEQHLILKDLSGLLCLLWARGSPFDRRMVIVFGVFYWLDCVPPKTYEVLTPST